MSMTPLDVENYLVELFPEYLKRTDKNYGFMFENETIIILYPHSVSISDANGYQNLFYKNINNMEYSSGMLLIETIIGDNVEISVI